MRFAAICLIVLGVMAVEVDATEEQYTLTYLDKAWAKWHGIPVESYIAQKNLEKTISDITTKVINAEKNFPPDEAKDSIKNHLKDTLEEKLKDVAAELNPGVKALDTLADSAMNGTTAMLGWGVRKECSDAYKHYAEEMERSKDPVKAGKAARDYLTTLSEESRFRYFSRIGTVLNANFILLEAEFVKTHQSFHPEMYKRTGKYKVADLLEDMENELEKDNNAANPIIGHWQGTYANSRKETGPSHMHFLLDTKGKLVVDFAGKRTDVTMVENGFSFELKSEGLGTYSYRGTITENNTRLVINYTNHRPERGPEVEPYTGTITLKR